MSDQPDPSARPPRSSADDAADALARMVAGDPSPPASEPPATPAPRPLPTPGTRALPATPKPRAADEPMPTRPVATPRPRALPTVSGTVATGAVRLRPSRTDAHRAWREALVPPMGVLGVLLGLTGVMSLTVGETLVIGTLPAWMGLTAIFAGLMLLASAVINARTLAGRRGL